MSVNFSTYQTQINDALAYENGANLANLLRPTGTHGKDLVKFFRNPPMIQQHRGSMVTPWDEITVHYANVCIHIVKGRPIEAFKEQSQLVLLFFRFFTENRGWTLLALFAILRDLRDLAHDADVHAMHIGQKSDHMEEAARIISKAFSNCMTDRISPEPESRKWGVYYVVGLILKSYFRIKRIALSKNILRALNANTDIPPLANYPRSHQVTFRYYIGMLGFLNEDYVKSEQELTLAFNDCHINAHGNQQRILTYLIPLRILKGHLPSSELMTRFPELNQIFSPFTQAIRQGDLAGYDRALERWEKPLLDLNLWLTLEKARELCLRGLFRRVWVAAEKSSRMPISMFRSGLGISGIQVDSEEAECLVANMIYKGFMRGYISHEKQTVVLANMNAFPRLTERQNPYSFM